LNNDLTPNLTTSTSTVFPYIIVQNAITGSGCEIGSPVTLQKWAPPEGAVNLNTTVAVGMGTIYFRPIILNNWLSLDHAAIPVFHNLQQSGTTSATSAQGGFTLVMGLYSRGTGTNQQRIEQILSRSGNISFTNSQGTQLGVTHPLATFSNSSAQSTSQYVISNATANSYFANTIAGPRIWMFPISSNLSPGEYFLGWAMSSSSNYAGIAMSAFLMLQSRLSLQNTMGGLQHWGQGSTVTGSGHNWPEGWGTYTVAGTTLPANITLSNGIRATTNASNYTPYFELVGYATSLAMGL
jgi:hypothetical protein